MKLKDLTPSARKTVVEAARRKGPAYGAALALARKDRTSRAIGLWTTYGSGASKRRYYSTITGTLLDTESARHPMTRHAEQALAEHEAHWLRQVQLNQPQLIAEIERAIGVCDRLRTPFAESCA